MTAKPQPLAAKQSASVCNRSSIHRSRRSNPSPHWDVLSGKSIRSNELRRYRRVDVEPLSSRILPPWKSIASIVIPAHALSHDRRMPERCLSFLSVSFSSVSFSSVIVAVARVDPAHAIPSGVIGSDGDENQWPPIDKARCSRLGAGGVRRVGRWDAEASTGGLPPRRIRSHSSFRRRCHLTAIVCRVAPSQFGFSP